MLIAWLAGAFAPRATRAARGLSAYAICAAVESSQLLHSPTLDALRATMLGHLVLGSGFDPRDFVSYALGVAIAVGLETALGRKAAHHGPASLEADQPSPVTDRAPHETAGADTHHGIRDTRGG